jgi:hypothetical protein
MLNPFYVVGFVDGEGCFCISLTRHGRAKPEVRLFFEIELREDDIDILRRIQKIFNCGNILRLDYPRYNKWRPHVKYKVGSFKDISSKIIPFFEKYTLQAKKRDQFQKFCYVAKMIKRKEHLTKEGIERIDRIRHKDSLDALDAHVQWGVS